jgi:hypothetical protein
MRYATLLLPLLACAPGEQPAPEDLEAVFHLASAEHDVPRDLLVALAYAQTRLDDRAGQSSRNRSVGIMDLSLEPGTPASAQRASDYLGLPVETIMLDRVANVRAGAWLLSDLAEERQAHTGEAIDTMMEWYPVVEDFAGLDDAEAANSFAAQVYDILELGLVVETPEGEWLQIEPHVFEWRDGERYATSGSALSSSFVAASSANYTNSSRSASSIDTVVIHTVQGSYSGCISWFQNSSAQSSAHYVVRSSDGEITQMVDEQDIGWHAGHWETNERSVGIEHEGYVEAPGTWYTDAMYRSSAALVKDICIRNGFPCDRDHVIAHYEVPGCSNPGGGGSSCHTDPGTGWDWDYFMSLIDDSGTGTGALPSAIADGAKSGSLQITAHVSGPNQGGTCSAGVSGSAQGGVLSLVATCVPDDAQQADDVGELTLQMSGTVVSGDTVEGRAALDGYGDSWVGEIDADGGVYATWNGSHDLGGTTGLVTYQATLKLEP